MLTFAEHKKIGIYGYESGGKRLKLRKIGHEKSTCSSLVLVCNVIDNIIIFLLYLVLFATNM